MANVSGLSCCEIIYLYTFLFHNEPHAVFTYGFCYAVVLLSRGEQGDWSIHESTKYMRDKNKAMNNFYARIINQRMRERSGAAIFFNPFYYCTKTIFICAIVLFRFVSISILYTSVGLCSAYRNIFHIFYSFKNANDFL